MDSKKNNNICSIVFSCCILVKVIYNLTSHRVSVFVKITAAALELGAGRASKEREREKAHGAERA